MAGLAGLNARWIALPAVLLLSSLLYLHSGELALEPKLEITLPEHPYRCPSLVGRALRRINHVAQVCSAVPSAHAEYSFELCHDPSICNSFTLRITRVDAELCTAVESDTRPLSEDPGLDQWIRMGQGPDAFEVRTDGAERTGSVSAVYEGHCRYRFDVILRNAGPVWLTAWHTYEKYLAFDEMDPEGPRLLRIPLFSDPIALSICSPRCTPLTAPMIDPNNSVSSYPRPPQAQLDRDIAREKIPACSGDSPVTGSYLPTHPLDVLYPPVKLPQSGIDHNPMAGRYQFVPHGCKWRHAGLRFGDPPGCTAKAKRILIIGDNHGRVIADGIFRRLGGAREIMTESATEGQTSHRIGNVDIHFIWDPFANNPEVIQCNPPSIPISEIDILIMGVAHHADTHTPSQHLSDLASALETFASCPAPPPHLLFLSAPAAPPRPDARDQRTNPRLQYWRARAQAAALDRGWAVVDQFARTLPFVWDALEGGGGEGGERFLGTDAIEPVLDEVIAKAGLCDE